MLEVLLNERDLLLVIRGLCDHLLNAASVRYFEDVGRLVQIKGHDLIAHVMHHLLSSGDCRRELARGVQHARSDRCQGRAAGAPALHAPGEFGLLGDGALSRFQPERQTTRR